MQITIDDTAGYCFGVKNAIGQAEAMLDEEGTLYSLGNIVHNPEEVRRLAEKGLKLIDHDELKMLSNCKVLIRAHGEPPSTYETAFRNNIMLIDATCPIVKHLQKMVRESQYGDNDSQIVIYGKKLHPEVLGLNGQIDNTAIVLKSGDDIASIDPKRDVHLFAQTTMDPEGFSILTERIKAYLGEHATADPPQLFVHDTTCRQVTNRIKHLKDFSAGFEIIIFVSGRQSSNGRFLFEICRSANPKSYHIENANDVRDSWLHGVESVGITGATSTPMYQLEKIRIFLQDFEKGKCG